MEQLPAIGLSLDTEPQDQPQNTYRFALNMLPDSVDGSQGAQTLEFANKHLTTLVGNVVGVIPMTELKHAVFTDAGFIYEVTETGYDSLVYRADFNFSVEYPITGQYAVQKGCEGVLYWRDSNNPDRYYNINKPDRFNNLNDFNINPDVNHPYSTTNVLQNGGRLEYGAYSFVYEILDASFNTVFKSFPSDVTYIQPHSNVSSTDVEAGGRPLSSNAIRIDIGGLDTRFNYLRIGVLYSTTSDGIVVQGHYIGEILPITASTNTFVYRGFNANNGDYIVLKDILLESKLNYDTSRVMEQVQGRLLRGNLVEQKRDYSSYQKYASKICTKYVVSEDAVYSEQGDEVIAKAVVYVHSDGTISAPFSIPGRAKLPHDAEIINSDFYTTPHQDTGIVTPIDLSLNWTAVIDSNGDTTISGTYSFSRAVSVGTLILVANQYSNPSDVTYQQTVNLASAGSFSVTFTTGVLENKPDLLFYFVTEDGWLYDVQTLVQLDFNGTITLETTLGEAATTIEAWTLRNTAVKDSTPIQGYVSSGLMGYYETSSVYTNPADYCGNDFWGVDCDGNPLLNTPIRHHRMPCRYIEPLVSNGKKRYIGVYYSNVEYPSTDVVGHYFVTSQRDETNSTVVAAGIMIPYNYTSNVYGDYEEGRYTHYLPNSYDDDIVLNSTDQNLISHEFLVDSRSIRGEFVKINGYFQSAYIDNRPEYDKFFATDLSYDDLLLYGKHHTLQGFVPSNDFVKVEDSFFLPYASRTLGYTNYSLTSDFNVLKLGRDPLVYNQNRANWNYVYVKNSIVVHNNLPSIRYRLSHSKPFTETSLNQATFTGDVFISKMDITNISQLTIGDSSNIFDNIFSEGPAKVEYEYIKDICIESPYNMESRLQGTECNVYYDQTGRISDFIIDKTCEIILPEKIRKWKLRDSLCKEWYGYNKDFSVINNYRKFTPLNYTYDYCSKCSNKYPNRIIWSEVQSEEQVSDSYRIFKPINYTDIPANRGVISDMDYKENNLIVRTEQSAYLLQPNPQRLQASGTSIILGTGEFLSIPPAEILSTEFGYCGQQHTLDKINTPHGLVWINQMSGKIFNYAGQVEEISRYKMYHWFDNNLKSSLETYLIQNGYVYNKDKFGCRLMYDPKTERLILHKTDYQPRFKTGNDIEFIDGNFYMNSVKLNYNNPVHFINKSFTISYSFRTKMWLSWHSYQPDFAYNNNNTYFTIIGGDIWSHENYYKFGNYYNISFDHILEYVDKSFPTYNLHAIYFYTTAQSRVQDEWIDNDDISFSHCLVYTRHQSTGKFQLKYIDETNELDSLDWSNTVKPLQEYNKQYKIDQIRDLAINSPVNTSNWEDTQIYYIDGQGYMDKVVNTNNVDLNLDQSDLREFNDTYANVRFYFNKDNYKLTLHIFDSMQFKSIS